MTYPHPVLLSQEDGSIQGANRFLALSSIINPKERMADLLDRSQCAVQDDDLNKVSDDYAWLTPPTRFQVVKFFEGGMTSADVESRMDEAGLRPANLRELLTFKIDHCPRLKSGDIIALGSSTKKYVERIYRQKNFLVKIIETVAGVHQEPVSYPMLSFGDILRLTKGERGWKNHCLFLGVYKRNAFDEKLVDFGISLKRYLKLPVQHSLTNEELQKTLPEGTFFRADDGHLCKIVKDMDRFKHQQDDQPVSERGLQHYRPIFTGIDYTKLAPTDRLV